MRSRNHPRRDWGLFCARHRLRLSGRRSNLTWVSSPRKKVLGYWGRGLGKVQVPGPEGLPRHPLAPCIPPPIPRGGPYSPLRLLSWSQRKPTTTEGRDREGPRRREAHAAAGGRKAAADASEEGKENLGPGTPRAQGPRANPSSTWPAGTTEVESRDCVLAAQQPSVLPHAPVPVAEQMAGRRPARTDFALLDLVSGPALPPETRGPRGGGR